MSAVEQLSETVFGTDWLKRHQTTYDFAERWLTFGSQTFRLRQPPVTGQCNRIFLVDEAPRSVLPATVPEIATSGCSPTPDVGPESMSTDIEVLGSTIVKVLLSPPPETLDDTLGASGGPASTTEMPPSESCAQLVPAESLRPDDEVLYLPMDCPKPSLADDRSKELKKFESIQNWLKIKCKPVVAKKQLVHNATPSNILVLYCLGIVAKLSCEEEDLKNLEVGPESNGVNLESWDDLNPSLLGLKEPEPWDRPKPHAMSKMLIRFRYDCLRSLCCVMWLLLFTVAVKSMCLGGLLCLRQDDINLTTRISDKIR